MKRQLFIALTLALIPACSKKDDLAGRIPDLELDDSVLRSKSPSTVDEAAGLLIQAMDGKSRVAFGFVERRDLILYHRSLGMLVRNEFNMWGSNTNLAYSYTNAHRVTGYQPDNSHPDTISGAIIERAWEKVQVLRK